MRKDLHRWFLFGLLCSGVVAIITQLLLQSEGTTATAVVACWAIVLGLIAYSHHRQQSSAARGPNFRSREMRCPWARDIRMHFRGVGTHG